MTRQRDRHNLPQIHIDLSLGELAAAQKVADLLGVDMVTALRKSITLLYYILQQDIPTDDTVDVVETSGLIHSIKVLRKQGPKVPK